MDERGPSLGQGASNSHGAGGYDHDVNTGYPELAEWHWWLLV